MICVTLPTHLRSLAQVTGPVALQVEEPITQRAILDALEAAYPMLRGTIRDTVTKQRRPFIRFYACGEDLSHEPPDAPGASRSCERERSRFALSVLWQADNLAHQRLTAKKRVGCDQLVFYIPVLECTAMLAEPDEAGSVHSGFSFSMVGKPRQFRERHFR